MDDVNWRRVFAISSSVMAVMLVGGSIYLHLQQKHHLGRMHYQPRKRPPVSVEAERTTQNNVDVDEDVFPELRPLILSVLRDLNLNAFIEVGGDPTREEPAAISSESSSESVEMTNNSSDSESNESPGKQFFLNINCTECLRHVIEDFGGARCCSDPQLPCGLIGVTYAKCLDTHNDNERQATVTAQCASSVKCAREAVAELVSKYFRDCNQDDTSNCRRNHAAARIFGPSGCASNVLLSIFESHMQSCV